MSIKTFSTRRRKRAPIADPHRPAYLDGMPVSQGIKAGKPIGMKGHGPGSKNGKVKRLTIAGHVLSEDWAGALRKLPQTRQAVPDRREYPVARFLVVPRAPERSVTNERDPGERRPCVIVNRHGQPKGDVVTHTVWEALWLGHRPGKRINLRKQAEALKMARRKPTQLIAIPYNLPNAEQLRQLVSGVILY